MRQCLKDIQTGEYAKSFILENKAGAPTLISRRRLTAEHQIEEVGAKLRAMMPGSPRTRWLTSRRTKQFLLTQKPASRRLFYLLM
jgi:ketol-acid reductoisomerase